MRHARLILLLPLLAALLPLAAWAQPLPALVVTLRDAADQGVPRVTVTIRDEYGQQVLAEGYTDANGQAVIDDVPLTAVRVAVSGMRTDTTPLVQLGDDASGLLVYLDHPQVIVDLRVDAQGVVVPDPAMLALEEQITPGEVIPTALVAATSTPLLTAPGAPTQGVPGPASSLAAAPHSESSGMASLGIVLIGLLLAAIAAVLISARRGI